MSLTSGTRLGPYEILAPLGAGGMGEVYRARDTKLNRDVALKILPAAFAADPDRLARFRREAQVLASLNHPNIGHIYGFEDALSPTSGQGGTEYALVLELVEGPTLADRIAQGPIPLADTLPIAKQIADALEAAHEQGIVHRDLKPANVKVRDDGTVKVLDFGLAKALEPTGATSADAAYSPTLTHRATELGVILGTAAYMAPEQAKGQAVDKRADIWSFGVVLYEMLTGRRLFGGDGVSDTLAAVLKEKPDWSRLSTDLPTPVRRLLRRCLEKDPRRRLSSISDARLELDEPEESHVPIGRSRARVPLGWLLGSAAAGAIVATIALLVFSSAERSPSPAPIRRLSMILPDDLSIDALRSQGVISPDGRLFAFMGTDQGSSTARIWLRPVEAAAARPLIGTDGATYPFWSPDSHTLGFFADGKLKKIATSGGEPEVLSDAPLGRGGAWAHDVIVFAPNGYGPLLQVSVSGGEPRAATTLDAARGETAHRFPSFLPDGRHFLFSVLPARDGRWDISVGAIDAPSHQFVVSAESGATYAEPGYLLFARRHRIVAQGFDPVSLKVAGEPTTTGDASGVTNVGGPMISASRTGMLAYLTDPFVRTRLAWFDPLAKEIGAVTGPPGFIGEVRLSHDDKRAALTRTTPDGDTDCWILDLDHGGLTRFSSGSGNYTNLVWSRDDRQLAFVNNRSGQNDLFVKSTLETTAAEAPIVKDEAPWKFPCDWSPDGRYFVYWRYTAKTGNDIWIVPLQGDRAPRPYLQTPTNEDHCVISPDGRWLAYNSDEAGTTDVYVQSFPSPGTRYRIGPASPASRRAYWNRSGTALTWPAPTDPEGRTHLVADIRTSPEFHVGPPRQWGVDPKGAVALAVTGDFSRQLASVSVSTTTRPSVTIVTDWVNALPKKL